MYELILSSKNNVYDLEKLIIRFEKLINKYAYKLKYEDAKQDLILQFIKIVKYMKLNNSMKNEAVLVSYLSKSIRNEYIRLSKQQSKINEVEVELNLDINYKDNIAEIEFDYITELLQKCLTEKEKTIISLIYIDGYKVSDISENMHISRQAVNQCKNRSLKKLKLFMS